MCPPILMQLKNFLTAKQWVANHSDSYFFFEPPITLGLPEGFKIRFSKTIQEQSTSPNRYTQQYIEDQVKFLSELYETPFSDLNHIIKNNSVIWRTRACDKSYSSGTMPINRYDNLIKTIKSITLKSSSFILSPSISIKEQPESARQYTRDCSVLAPEKGSFITKIELPFSGEIKRSASGGGKKNQDVTEYIQNVFLFIHNQINECEDLDELMDEHSSIINLEVFSEFQRFYELSNTTEMEVNFTGVNSSIALSSDNVKEKIIKPLIKLNEKIKINSLRSEILLGIGNVIQLQSDNISEDKNIATVIVKRDRDFTRVKVKLNSAQYMIAIDAHRNRKNVVLKGEILRNSRTPIMINPTHFEIRE